MNRKQRRTSERANKGGRVELVTTYKQQIQEFAMTQAGTVRACVICGDPVNVSEYCYKNLHKHLCADCAEIRANVYQESWKQA